MTNNAERELLPCPWCGNAMGEAHISHGSTFRWRKVNGCCSDGPEVRHDTLAKDQSEADIDSRRRAIEAWNTRAHASGVPDDMVKVGGCKYTHSASVGHVYEIFWLLSYKDKPLCDIDLYMCAASPTPPKSASVPVERLEEMRKLCVRKSTIYGSGAFQELADSLAELIAEYKA
jgi:hypothetical protein